MNKVVVADDDDAIQLLYQEELGYEGYEVLPARTRGELLNIIIHEKPDLIVLDVVLGEDNGLDVLQEIRNAYYDLPVILCTAYEEFRHDLKSMAADYYVIKRSDLSELKRKIKMAFESVPFVPEKEGGIGSTLGFRGAQETGFNGAGM